MAERKATHKNALVWALSYTQSVCVNHTPASPSHNPSASPRHRSNPGRPLSPPDRGLSTGRSCRYTRRSVPSRAVRCPSEACRRRRAEPHARRSVSEAYTVRRYRSVRVNRSACGDALSLSPAVLCYRVESTPARTPALVRTPAPTATATPAPAPAPAPTTAPTQTPSGGKRRPGRKSSRVELHYSSLRLNHG